MRKDDFIRIQHMIEAAKEALQFATGKLKKDLETNRMLTLALVKSIEIVGEAASKITKETKEEYPEIPWPSIIAMRNRLIHAYFDIDHERLWDTIIDDLPLLIKSLENIALQNK